MNPPLETLFPSKARRALLELLFSASGGRASVSELARRAELTPRAVAVEVEKLRAAGLVEVEAAGAAHIVRANPRHPVAAALEQLLRSARTTPRGAVAGQRAVRESLAAYGAPLLGARPRRHLALGEAVLRGLELARTDATVLRVLPLVVVRNLADFDWMDLRERARRMNLRSELGMLLELTSDVAGLPALRSEASPLRDGRRKRSRFFLAVHGQHERKLAQLRTPPSVARWKFWLNMPEDVFRETLRKHVAS